MFHAIRVALTLALTILVLRWLLPEIAEPLINLVVNFLDFANSVIEQASWQFG